MKIKEGFDGQESNIDLSVESRRIELWIRHDAASVRDILLYLTPTELHDLLCDVQDAARKLFGMK